MGDSSGGRPRPTPPSPLWGRRATGKRRAHWVLEPPARDEYPDPGLHDEGGDTCTLHRGRRRWAGQWAVQCDRCLPDTIDREPIVCDDPPRLPLGSRWPDRSLDEDWWGAGLCRVGGCPLRTWADDCSALRLVHGRPLPSGWDDLDDPSWYDRQTTCR